MRTYVRVTSQGSAHGRFRRALDRRQVGFALEAAGEMRKVGLDEALELVELLASAGDKRFSAAARRWLSRFAAERKPSLAELQIAKGAMAELADQPQSAVARDTLAQLLEPSV